MGEGELERRVEVLLGARTIDDADARPEPRRLDDDREAERALDRLAVPRRTVRLRATGTPLSRMTDLKRSLSIAERRGGHARADVGDAGELEEPLDGAVLAERPVQDGEDDVHLAERLRHAPSPRPGRGRPSGRLAELERRLRRRGSSQRPSRPISISRTS